MFERIVRIDHVGVFDAYRAVGNVSFGELTCIFAPNGAGKTTLVAILRSLKEQSSTAISERRTVGSAGPQHVHIRESGRNLQFDGQRWDDGCAELEIFDEEFINRNIHGDEGPQADHRRGMYEVIIGEGGAALRERIVQLDQDIRAITPTITRLERELSTPRGDMPLEQFLSLQADPDVEEKILAKEAELRALRDRAEIMSRPMLREVALPEVAIAPLSEVLARSLATLSGEAESRVRARLSERLEGRGEQWVSAGIEFGTHEDCPFCGLPTAGNDLIAAYQGYFSGEYSQLKRDVASAITALNDAVGPAVSGSIAATAQQNSQAFAFWREHLEEHLPDFDVPALAEICASTHERLSGLVRRKQDVLLEPIELGAADRDAVNSHARQRSVIADYSAAARRINDAISNLRERLGRTNSAQAEANLRRLRSIQARHDPANARSVDELLEARRRKTEMEEEKRATRDQLDRYSGDLLTQYQESINAYLTDFAAGFQIGTLQQTYVGGQPSCHFPLVVRATEIPTNRTAGPGTVRFKSVLSGGDKRSLALAFFLARLAHCPDLANTRVVLDDPMCSLDRSRRLKTARHIVRLARRARQIVLLSHDRDFLRLVWDEAEGANIPRVGLCIAGVANSAIIREWDIIEETAPGFYRQIALLDEFLGGGRGDPVSVKRALRPLLETWLRHRRPRAFGPKVWLGDMIERIRNAPVGDSLEPLGEHLDVLTDVNAYTREDHHGADPGAAPDAPDERELQGFVREVLRLVCET